MSTNKSLTVKDAVDKLCPYCLQPIVTPIFKEIIQRDRKAIGGVKMTKMKFCSIECSTWYQFEREG